MYTISLGCSKVSMVWWHVTKHRAVVRYWAVEDRWPPSTPPLHPLLDGEGKTSTTSPTFFGNVNKLFANKNSFWDPKNTPPDLIPLCMYTLPSSRWVIFYLIFTVRLKIWILILKHFKWFLKFSIYQEIIEEWRT